MPPVSVLTKLLPPPPSIKGSNPHGEKASKKYGTSSSVLPPFVVDDVIVIIVFDVDADEQVGEEEDRMAEEVDDVC